ncbi:MAG: glycosyltransferase [Oligoflexales bacterium]|nr:glycosyltransferase [Oligoflexales bacterium]
MNLSIIIPIAPKELCWKLLVNDLIEYFELDKSISAEILIVGAESDDCSSISKELKLLKTSLPMRCVQSLPSRAKQMNKGAQLAEGEYLWFLHADSRVGTRAISKLAKYIVTHDQALTYFNLLFLKDGPLLMWLNVIGVWWRSHIKGLPFGDQGFCMPKKVFFKDLNAYDENVVKAEDHALIWQARAKKISVKPLAAFLYTSARRYQEQGWWKTTRWHRQLTRDQIKDFQCRYNNKVN